MATASLLPDPRLEWQKLRRSRKKLRLFRGADVVVVSYAKSGRTWLSVLISHIVHQKFGTPVEELVSSSKFRKRHPAVPVFFMTADNFAPARMSDAALLSLYGQRKVLLLVRDPRDVAVSHYFQLSKRCSPLTRSLFGVPDDLGEMSLFDFVCGEAGLPQVIDWLNRWERRIAQLPRALRISYEELRADTPRVLRRVTDFIGWRCSDAEIAAAVDFASFEKLQSLERQRFFHSGRMQPGDAADAESYKVRRGKVGGYRDYFSPEEIDRIDALVAERLAPGLGYRCDSVEASQRPV